MYIYVVMHKYMYINKAYLLRIANNESEVSMAIKQGLNTVWGRRTKEGLFVYFVQLGGSIGPKRACL